MMNRRVLIIGNSAGLAGVAKDINNYSAFFQSNHGGAWFDSEIIVRNQPTKSELTKILDDLSDLDLEYLITVYAGHGGYQRQTVLEINKNGEMINERDLHICKKQLLIFDCCRAVISRHDESKTAGMVLNRAASAYRERYETAVRNAIMQKPSLYACAIGEGANDTDKGGAYSVNLLDSTSDLLQKSTQVFIDEAHEEAKKRTENQYNDQHPEAVLPRCLSSQRLIWALR